MKPLDVRQSVLIKAMRFPLIVLVVIAHAAGTPPESLSFPLDGVGCYSFVTEMLSRHLCPIGVCWFFVFSGYFFFINLKDGQFGYQWILGKWKSRVHSLLIPYLIWNILAIVLPLIVSVLCGAIGITQSTDAMWVVRQGPLYWLVTGPANMPLWFMRDLMLLSLIAPLYYLLVKKFPWVGLAIIIVFYLSCLLPSIPQYRAICFFGLGVWLGIGKFNILGLCRKVMIPAAILAVVLLLVSTSLIGHPGHELVRRLFYPFGMVTFMNLCDHMMNRGRVEERLTRLSAAVFFIYAAHEILILGWTKSLLLRIFGSSLVGMWVNYLLTPVIVLTVCLGLFWLLNKIMPKTLAFACGGRTHSSSK